MHEFVEDLSSPDVSNDNEHGGLQVKTHMVEHNGAPESPKQVQIEDKKASEDKSKPTKSKSEGKIKQDVRFADSNTSGSTDIIAMLAKTHKKKKQADEASKKKKVSVGFHEIAIEPADSCVAPDPRGIEINVTEWQPNGGSSSQERTGEEKSEETRSQDRNLDETLRFAGESEASNDAQDQELHLESVVKEDKDYTSGRGVQVTYPTHSDEGTGSNESMDGYDAMMAFMLAEEGETKRIPWIPYHCLSSKPIHVNYDESVA